MTTDTFTDARGRRVIAGFEVPEPVWQRYERAVAALDAIAGPSWDTGPGPWLSAYREAGGGYEGLQAIAKLALNGGSANA